MEKRRWTQPKSLELHKWIHFLWNAKAQPLGFPIQVNRKDHKVLLTNVANIRHFAVHRCPQDAKSVLVCLEAAYDFAKLHQDVIAADEIARLTAKVQEILQEVSSQQTVLRKRLQERVDELIAQQRTLMQQSQAEACVQNQQALAQAGESVIRLVHMSTEQVAPIHSTVDDCGDGKASVNDAMGSDDSFDPSDVDEMEAVLLAAEQLGATATKDHYN
ncbi:hypothetical protein H2198_006521 [Neophaeococcomyces mojaviensis]|uniref:Uncharacterized protein n=1 Tax=Neophaeococcomyces mojaviensis TaxID=3383035 RepID=A0ACC3A318_9EURO|nr:hypothetical protein H2198_006521 [Knufia sp. JES_112]